MNQLVLLDKCNGLFTGTVTVLPETFCIRIEGYEGTDEMNIVFTDENDRCITVEPISLDDEHSKSLKCFGTMEHIRVMELMMSRVSNDLASFAANNKIDGYEDAHFDNGVVPLYIFEDLWQDYLESVIDKINELYAGMK